MISIHFWQVLAWRQGSVIIVVFRGPRQTAQSKTRTLCIYSQSWLIFLSPLPVLLDSLVPVRNFLLLYVSYCVS